MIVFQCISVNTQNTERFCKIKVVGRSLCVLMSEKFCDLICASYEMLCMLDINLGGGGGCRVVQQLLV
jgi:hypothetical protein